MSAQEAGMEQMNAVVAQARDMGASDIHISEGLPLMFRINGMLVEAPVELPAEQSRAAILSMLDDAQRARCMAGEDVDTALQTPDGNRQRVNVFHQQAKLAATVRLLNNTIPTLSMLGACPGYSIRWQSCRAGWCWLQARQAAANRRPWPR